MSFLCSNRPKARARSILHGFRLNSPAAVKRLQELANLIKAGIIADPNVVGTSQDVCTRWLANNKVAICCANSNDILTMQKLDELEFAVTTYPGGPVVQNTTIYKSNLVGIASKTKNLAAA